MTRWKLTVEYDGTGLVGWQKQDNGPSVQAALAQAAGRLAGHEVEVFGAGRTDARVHALGQVAHIDIAKPMASDGVRDALNFWMRKAGVLCVAVLSAEAVPDDFHARFSAIRRSYLYRILDRRVAPALLRGRVWHVKHSLDAEAMARAAKLLEGRHDFSSFRAVECQAKSPVKTLDRLTVERRGDEIAIEAEARSFLHHQVRNFTGSLKWVGEGRWSADDLQRALDAKDRRKGGPTAPAHGLYLMSVGY